MKNILYAIILILISRPGAAVHFTSGPTLTRDTDGKLWVEFALSDTTDVAVSILDPRDSSVVRRLAAGLMGGNAPAPLARQSLHQRIEWDGMDDYGFPPSNPGGMQVRVRAGIGVSFDRYAGYNPYSFTKGLSEKGGAVFGLVQGPGGSVFICGNPGAIYHYHIYRHPKIIRQYDLDGNYLKTVYPYSAELGYDLIKGWKPRRYPDSASVTPVYPNNSLPGWSVSMLDVTREGAAVPSLHFIDRLGRLYFGQAYAHESFGQDGAKTDTACFLPTITAPALPLGQPMLFGLAMMTPVPGSDDVLLSGIFSGTNSSGHLTLAMDTGFYRDGRIYRLNPATRTASLFLSLDTVVTTASVREALLNGEKNYTAELHGTAFDSKGRLYVCDRLHRRISVYDTTDAALLGSIPLTACDRVSISPSTGHVFATSRTGLEFNGYVRLFKFAPFDSGAARICSLTVAAVGSDNYLLVNESAGIRRIWMGLGDKGAKSVILYDDTGAGFAVYKDFNEKAAKETPGFDRILVDRRNEAVYFNDTWHGVYKITDWNQPVIRACSTTAHQRLYSGELAISPQNLLYLRKSIPGTGGTWSDISRYTLTSGLHQELPYTNTGKNIVTPYLYNRMGTSSGLKGLAVSPDGTVATMHFNRIGANTAGENRISFYADTGSNDTGYGRTKIWPVANQSGGIRFDLLGNLYVGVKTANPALERPALFASDWAFNSSIGSIVRFPAGFDTAAILESGVQTASAYKIYPVGLAPFSKDATAGNCICRSPRFDVDPYGRLFLPNAITSQVTITDNEGNILLRFGQYGNADDPAGGGLIPLSWPTSVAASEDYIYVTDFGGNRIARARLDYELDNFPGLSNIITRDKTAECDLSGMKAHPNPFNPSTQVTFATSRRSRVRIEVFAVDGRFITTLASDILEPGRHHVDWRGKDRLDRPVAAGTYYVRICAGKSEGFIKVVFAK